MVARLIAVAVPVVVVVVALVVLRPLQARLALLIPVAAVVVQGMSVAVVLVVPASWSFATPILMMQLPRLLGHPPSRFLADIASISGLALGALHSNGTLC